jgi:hypothetical protein
MFKRLILVFATLALSSVAFAQRFAQFADDYQTQVGYAANLNIGDTLVNLANTGGFFVTFPPIPDSEQNICVNVYAFDPQEEEVSCCACLVTPFGLNSLSVKNDLINNTLTPAVPNSLSIYLISTEASQDPTGNFTVCNPAIQNQFTLAGMVAWGSTFEPAGSPGTYTPVSVRFKGFEGDNTALGYLPLLCGFIQSNGSGYGICNSCRTGALSGTKK